MKKKNNNTRFESKEIKVKTIKNDDYQKVISFFVILVVVLVCLGGLFFFNGKYVSKDEFQEKETTTTQVSLDTSIILAADILNQKDSKYMVMIFNSKEKSQKLFNGSLVSGYQGNEKLYTVDLSNKMNASIYDAKGKENLKVSSISELKVTKPTLLVVQGGKVINAVTDNETMVEMLRKQ